MKIQLSEHFTYKKLLQFVFPSIIMMIFTSIYSVVDGLFVSNFVGKSAFAAVNLIMPFLMGISALGFMIGTGGSAIVAKTLGEGKTEKANEYFSMLVYITAIGGIIIAILSMFLVKPVAILFGANGALLDNCILYGRILCISLPAFMLQNVFQSFFCNCRKATSGTSRNRDRRRDKYGSRLFICSCTPPRASRCRVCDCMRRVYRRTFPVILLWTEKFQLIKAWKNTFSWQNLIKDLYQWLVRAYDQSFQLCCKCSL